MTPLPHNLDAEKGLLCSFFHAPLEVGSLCAERGIVSGSFYLPGHAAVFSALMALWETGAELSLITVIDTMARRETLAMAGGAASVTEIYTFLPTSVQAKACAEIVEEKSTLRKIAIALEDYAAKSRQPDADSETLLNRASQRISEIAQERSAKRERPPTLKEALMQKLERMEAGEADDDKLATGIAGIDRQSPLRRGDMMLISGERKSGKSILSLTMACNLATAGFPVLYFSLEDRIPKVIDRIFAGVTRVPLIKTHISHLDGAEIARVTSRVAAFSGAPLTLRDDVYDLAAMVAVSRSEKARCGHLAAIVFDYAQLVRTDRKKGDNREQEVATVSRTLRLLGMELNVAIILLCQLNKEGDTRESKALEQDCTAMLKILPPSDKDDEPSNVRTIAIPFQRNGESGIAMQCAFLGHIARFENLANEKP